MGQNVNSPFCNIRAVTFKLYPRSTRIALESSSLQLTLADQRCYEADEGPPQSSAIELAAPPRTTSRRDFVPWRFSAAGRRSAWLDRHHRRPKTLYGACRCQEKTRHALSHFVTSLDCIAARLLSCSAALSGQSPKAACGAPKARGLTANAQTESQCRCRDVQTISIL